MRIRNSAIKIDMFPFLSVLCAVIGVLMLFLLLVISSRIVDDTSQHTPESSAATHGESGSPLTAEDITQFRAELARLSAELDAERSALSNLQQRRNYLRELLALNREQSAIAYGDALFAGVELSADISVFMKPADDVRVTKQPQFIEADLSGYVAYPDQERFSLNDLPSEDHAVTIDHQPTTPMERLLDRADRKRDHEYIVFLIRPSGCESFDRARSYLARRYPHARTRQLSRIDIGWEPFAPEWLLAAENPTSP